MRRPLCAFPHNHRRDARQLELRLTGAAGPTCQVQSELTFDLTGQGVRVNHTSMSSKATTPSSDLIGGHHGGVSTNASSLGWLVGGRSYAGGHSVREAQEMVAAANQLLEAAVIAERANGTSWEVIGEALSVTRSTAHGRVSGSVDSFFEAGEPETARDKAGENLDGAWDKIAEQLSRHTLLSDVQQVAEHLSSPPPAATESTEAGTNQVDAYARALNTLLRWRSPDFTIVSDEGEPRYLVEVKRGERHGDRRRITAVPTPFWPAAACRMDREATIATGGVTYGELHRKISEWMDRDSASAEKRQHGVEITEERLARLEERLAKLERLQSADS
jgi:hypothetical protein